MIPRRITGATHCFTAPSSWDEERNGRCLDLHVRVSSGNACASAWEPLPEEVDALNRGGSVIITIYGGQPPVSLHVEAAEDGLLPPVAAKVTEMTSELVVLRAENATLRAVLCALTKES